MDKLSGRMNTFYPSSEELRDLVRKTVASGAAATTANVTEHGVQVDVDPIADAVYKMLGTVYPPIAARDEEERLRKRTHEIAATKDREIGQLKRELRRYTSLESKLRENLSKGGVVGIDRWDNLSWEARATGTIVAQFLLTSKRGWKNALKRVGEIATNFYAHVQPSKRFPLYGKRRELTTMLNIGDDEQ